MDFFYPNFNNDMWRIIGLIFFGDKSHFEMSARTAAKRFDREKIAGFCAEKGIALYDTASAVRRTKNTASDKDLEIVTPTDIDALLRRIPACVAVATTGQKATDVFTSRFGMRQPKVGTSEPFTFDGRQMRLYRMPSSSRAYPMKVENKAAYYEKMFEEIGLKD